MFRVKVENEVGDILNISEDRNYLITNIEGTSPPSSTIIRAGVAGQDGSRYNSSTVNERNLVMYIRFMSEVEKSRIKLYKYLRTGKYVKFYFSNGTRDVFIEGYIEDMPVNNFSQAETMQVVILCNKPYFNAIDEVLDMMNNVKPLLRFPYATYGNGQPLSVYEKAVEINVINSGDVDSGFELILTARGEVVNPKIINGNTLEFLGVNFTMEAGDKIIFNTSRGSRSVTLIRDNEQINIFNYLMQNKTWLQLKVGDNLFVADTESGGAFLDVTFKHRDLFEGV